MRKTFLTSIALLICGVLSPLSAQDDITEIFKSGIADLNTVAKGYLIPGGNAFAAGMGSNWYNTAETHHVLGFDLRVGVSGTQIPSSDQMFSLAGLTNLEVSGNATEAPTFGGKGIDGVQLSLMQPHYMSDGTTVNPLYNNGNGVITSFTTPSGVSEYVPTASVQLTLGLPLNNDLMVRFVPTIKSNGAEGSIWGVGIKNNFKKLIPGFKLLPFSASVMVAYNQLDVTYAFPTSAQVTPDALVKNGLDYIDDPKTNANTYKTQGMKLSASSITANIIVSKDLLFITPYLGFGITQTNFDLTMTGNYPTLGDPVRTGPTTYAMQIKNIADPVSLTSSEVMPGATVGLKFKILFILSAHAQYTFQKYPTASVGFGIGLR